jgi:antitoxin (DNA-binding transcriptional repressor) of toxin-antitoxin stability system
MTVRISEAELARDIHAVLAKVQEGIEVIVEQNHRPVAVIKTPRFTGRLLSAAIALAAARGSTVTLDDGFMRDMGEGIASRSRPWTPTT